MNEPILDKLIEESQAKLRHWQIVKELAFYRGPKSVTVVKNTDTNLLESIHYEDAS